MAISIHPDPVFSVGASGSSTDGWLARSMTRLIDRWSGLAELQRLYAASARRTESRFVDRALGALDVSLTVDGRREDIPATGPLVVVANHPRGALDGLALASILLSRRSDVRILGNRALARIPEIAELLIPVDVFDGPGAARTNARALRETRRCLQAGGCVCVFPAGEVAHGGWARQAIEPPWQSAVTRVARCAGAPVLSVWLDGSVGRGFRLAGLIHPRLRTLLLPRLLLSQRGASVRVRVGTAVAPTVQREPAKVVASALADAAPESSAPAIVGADAVAREVAGLLEGRALISQGDYTVVWTRGVSAPALLECVGRAREIAFRAAGEGTGRDIDLDAFDPEYVHLCLWDRRAGTLAGAYRMGLMDELEERNAPLYTSTLFELDRHFGEAVGPAIELGRAFLAAPYQRQFAPLALLWSAIGRFVAMRPHYRTLFGSVSIDTAYGPVARHAMVTYLQQHASAASLTPLVTPRHPPTADDLAEAHLAWAGTFASPDLSVLEAVVSRLDPQGRGVPVLLRQYLKLDARAVAFSIDPAFSHVLDALIVVDLPAVSPTLLRRFMGPAQAETYLQHRVADGARVRQSVRRRA